MIWIGYLVLIFNAIRLIVSLYNRTTRPFMPISTTRDNQLISVLVPARNEAHNITNLLNSLKAQTYKNLEIIICNDQSTDDTTSIVEGFSVSDSRIRLIHIESLPDGWLGKNNACSHLASKASGEYFCFLDADVLVKPHFLSSVISYISQKHVSLLSFFPEQIMLTPGEKATVPIMLRILLSLLPLRLVLRSPYPSLSAANGQCMVFTRSSYLKYKPHELFKNIKAEDIATARFFKSQREQVACLLGKDQISCRMYNNYAEAVNGFAKNINAFFGGSYVAAFFYGLLTSPILISLLFFQLFELLLVILCLMICTEIMILINSCRSLKILKYYVIQEIVYWHILCKSVLHKVKKSGRWKGRNIYFYY